MQNRWIYAKTLRLSETGYKSPLQNDAEASEAWEGEGFGEVGGACEGVVGQIECVQAVLEHWVGQESYWEIGQVVGGVVRSWRWIWICC